MSFDYSVFRMKRRWKRVDAIEWPRDKYEKEIKPGTLVVFNSGGSDLRIGTVTELKQRNVWYIDGRRINSGNWKAEVNYDGDNCTVKDIRKSIVI